MKNQKFGEIIIRYPSITEAITGIAAIAFLIYTMRDMLLSGDTTLPHDMFMWHIPIFQFFAENVISGHLPLWNPFTHSGEPFYLLPGHNMLFEPITILVVFLGQFITKDTIMLFNWHHFIRCLVMLFGVYIVFRPLPIHLFIRLTIIPILLFSSFMLVSFRHAGVLGLFLWVPYISYFLLRIVYYKDYRWYNWLLFAGLIGLSWQSYYFSGTWVFLLVFFLGLLFFRRDLLKDLFMSRRFILKFTAAAVIILAMMVPNIILLLEKNDYVYPPRMMRIDGIEGTPADLVPSIIMPYWYVTRTGGTTSIWDYIQIISPEGNHNFVWADRVAWGAPTEHYIYLGIITWVIAVLGIVAGRHDLKKVWLLLLFGIGLLMMGPAGGLHRLLYYIYPPLWFLRHTSHFVLFFTFAFLYFYILGFNHIFSKWQDSLFSSDTRKKQRTYLAFLIPFVCVVAASVYWMTRISPPFVSYAKSYLFCFIIPIFIIGWFVKKHLWKKGLFIGIIASHIIIVLIFTANTFEFLIYVALTFGIPLLVFLFIRRGRTLPGNVRYSAAYIMFIVFAVSLTWDLIYSFQKSDSFYLSQKRPELVTSIEKPSFSQNRFISPPQCWSELGAASMRYTSLLCRQSFVFSPTRFFKGSSEAYDPHNAMPETFNDALRGQRWQSMFLRKNYFELLNSGIPPAAMEEMFAVGGPVFQFKESAVVAEDNEVFDFLNWLGPERSVQFLRDHVIVDKLIEPSMKRLSVSAGDHERENQTAHDITGERFSHQKQDIFFSKSNNYCSSDLKIEASSVHKMHDPQLRLCDRDPSTIWHVSPRDYKKPAWVKIDLGEGNKTAINCIRAKPRMDIPGQFFRHAVFEGSNDNRTWQEIALITQEDPPRTAEWIDSFFPNDNAYRYYRLYINDGIEGGPFISLAELEMYYQSNSITIDFGLRNKKAVNYIKTKLKKGASGELIRHVTIKGSNDNKVWRKIASMPQDHYPKTGNWSFPNDDAYRYYRIDLNGDYDGNTFHPIDEVIMCRSNIGQYGYSLFDLSAINDKHVQPIGKAIMSQTNVRQNGYNFLEMDVVTDKPGMLYWVDGYHKGWSAYIDGKKVPVYRANINFKAIAVPEGKSNIRFTYNPIFKAGLFAFYGSFILSALTALVTVVFNRYDYSGCFRRK